MLTSRGQFKSQSDHVVVEMRPYFKLLLITLIITHNATEENWNLKAKANDQLSQDCLTNKPQIETIIHHALPQMPLGI